MKGTGGYVTGDTVYATRGPGSMVLRSPHTDHHGTDGIPGPEVTTILTTPMR